jgi:hypothetical protein
MIAIAVNCFDTDATWKIVPGAFGTSASRIADPKPAS